MDIRSVRLMSDDQLLDAIEDKRLELFNLRFQQVSAEVENTNQLRHAKRFALIDRPARA
jgi:ribosomal protein L29